MQESATAFSHLVCNHAQLGWRSYFLFFHVRLFCVSAEWLQTSETLKGKVMSHKDPRNTVIIKCVCSIFFFFLIGIWHTTFMGAPTSRLWLFLFVPSFPNPPSLLFSITSHFFSYSPSLLSQCLYLQQGFRMICWISTLVSVADVAKGSGRVGARMGVVTSLTIMRVGNFGFIYSSSQKREVRWHYFSTGYDVRH